MKTHMAIADVGQVAQRQGIISNDNNRTSLKYSRVRATDMFFSSDGEPRHHPEIDQSQQRATHSFASVS
jgi:hypothetical protein